MSSEGSIQAQAVLRKYGVPALTMHAKQGPLCLLPVASQYSAVPHPMINVPSNRSPGWASSITTTPPSSRCCAIRWKHATACEFSSICEKVPNRHMIMSNFWPCTRANIGQEGQTWAGFTHATVAGQEFVQPMCMVAHLQGSRTRPCRHSLAPQLTHCQVLTAPSICAGRGSRSTASAATQASGLACTIVMTTAFKTQ